MTPTLHAVRDAGPGDAGHAAVDAPDAGASARGQSDQSRVRRERQPAATSAEDGTHLQLRRKQGPAVHAAGSAGHGQRRARHEREHVEAPASSRAAAPRTKRTSTDACRRTRRRSRGKSSETDPHARDGAALLKRVVGHVGSKPDGPQIRVSVYTPAQATKKVPIILLLNFGGGPARAGGPAAQAPAAATPPRASRRTPRTSSRADGAMRPWATTTSSPIAPMRGRKG